MGMEHNVDVKIKLDDDTTKNISQLIVTFFVMATVRQLIKDVSWTTTSIASSAAMKAIYAVKK